MASKRRIRRRRCDKKKRYKTKEEACKDIWILMKKQPGDKFNWWKCKHCKGWHVGHTMLRYY
jgi:hypothetical protein